MIVIALLHSASADDATKNYLARNAMPPEIHTHSSITQ